MNEQELREMVRDSIARHRGQPSHGQLRTEGAALQSHAAFALLPLVRGGDDDGKCLIEPAVRCSHCGYCQSYGH